MPKPVASDVKMFVLVSKLGTFSTWHSPTLWKRGIFQTLLFSVLRNRRRKEKKKRGTRDTKFFDALTVRFNLLRTPTVLQVFIKDANADKRAKIRKACLTISVK